MQWKSATLCHQIHDDTVYMSTSSIESLAWSYMVEYRMHIYKDHYDDGAFLQKLATTAVVGGCFTASSDSHADRVGGRGDGMASTDLSDA